LLAQGSQTPPTANRVAFAHAHATQRHRIDVPLILQFIRGLAEYERLAHACVATEESVRETLFGAKRYAEVIIAEHEGAPAGFALFFHNYSTFLARPGIYLEDLYVRPELRGYGIGKALLAKLASIAMERNCGRLEWAVLNWNEPAIQFYRSLGALPQDQWTVYRLTGEALGASPVLSRAL
jgi:GNAT superfamily N-acetyltransferase